jgi:hypothetical protein
VRLGGDGAERFAWAPPDGTVAEAVPTPDGGARVRVVRAKEAEVVRLGPDGALAETRKTAGEWPLALAGEWTLVRTEAGPRLQRDVPVALEGDRTGLAALPDGGVVAWGATEVEARGPDAAPRWKVPTDRPARVTALGNAVAVVDASGLRLLDAVSGAIRVTVPAKDVRLGTELAVVVDGATATAYGPDGAKRWTASPGGTLSADGRVAWDGSTVRRLPDGPPATLDAPVRTAVAIGDGALALIGDESPRVVLLGADGRPVASEAVQPALHPLSVFALADGLLVHGAPNHRPGQVLVRIRALPQ